MRHTYERKDIREGYDHGEHYPFIDSICCPADRWQPVQYGALFLQTNVFFLMFNCINHTLAGALRGRGDSTGPMVIMLLNFVAVRHVNRSLKRKEYRNGKTQNQ